METGDFNTLKKNYAKGIELRGKTLGIIGFGRIGQSLASYALAIGMQVIAVGKIAEECEVELAEIPGLGTPKLKVSVITDLDYLLANADFISIHVPKQADGSAVITATEFAKMKKGVRIANAARGGVVNEDDLLDALESGVVAGIALDVYENEPNPRKDLLNHPKIACTPHIGAATLEAQDRIGLELANLIIKQFGTF
jgi:D-3-phosphoglycerate dehydrogenase